MASPQLVVVPHAAPQYSGYAAARAYAAAARACRRATPPAHIRHVVLLCTRHSGIPDIADAADPSTEPDHSLAHQLPFLRRWFPTATTREAYLVGPLPTRPLLARAARRMERACMARPGTLVVASGDFMHVGPRFDHPIPSEHADDVSSYTKARETVVVRALSQPTADARSLELDAADAAGLLTTVCGAWVFRLLARMRCFEGRAGRVTCYYTSAQVNVKNPNSNDDGGLRRRSRRPPLRRRGSRSRTTRSPRRGSPRAGVTPRAGVANLADDLADNLADDLADNLADHPRPFRRLTRTQRRRAAVEGCVSYVSLHYAPVYPPLPPHEALTGYEGRSLLRWGWSHVRARWRSDDDGSRAAAHVAAFHEPFRTPGMERRDMGVFVTYTSAHPPYTLRGCLGTVDNAERRPLVDAVAHFAVQAGFHDPRPGLTGHQPLRDDEAVRMTLTLLGHRTPLSSIAAWHIHRDGLYVERRDAPSVSAVYLPSVATEQGWDRHTTFAHLVSKAEGRTMPDPDVLAARPAAVSRYALFAVPGRAYTHTWARRRIRKGKR